MGFKIPKSLMELQCLCSSDIPSCLILLFAASSKYETLRLLSGRECTDLTKQTIHCTATHCIPLFSHRNLSFEMKEHAVLLHEYKYGMSTTEAHPSIFLTSYIYAYSFQRKHTLLYFPSSLIM